MVVLPMAALLAGTALVAPVEAAPQAPCTMTVKLDRTSTQTYANGVQRDVYNVKVTYGGKTQTAEVHRMVMPAKTQPRLVTMKMGALGQLRSQLNSKKGARGIAAVNGDFFYGYRVSGDTVYLPRAASVTHGHPVRMNADRMRVVGIDKFGVPYDDEVGVTGTVTHGSTSFPVTSVNWQSVGDSDVGIYTHDWADTSTARRPSGAVEWVVKRKTILAVRTGNDVGKSVAPKTKVVAFGRAYATAAKRAKVGTDATVTVQQVTSTGVPLREGVGRGVNLVREGQANVICQASKLGARPRTTVGWTSTGRWMTLSLPGTGYDRSGYRIGGLGLAQEANAAVALGFYEAVELDGGGSTTAFVRRADNDWDRVDDRDGIYQRPIPNALLFVRQTR